MTTEAFVGRVYLERGGGGSPETYTRVCEVFGISGVGEVAEQIDSTTFCSGGVREYIAGLADGSEITVEANFIVDSEARRNMIADAKNKLVVSYRLVVDDDGDDVTDLTMWFRATALGGEFAPSGEDKNAINYTLKISGEIDITEP